MTHHDSGDGDNGRSPSVPEFRSSETRNGFDAESKVMTTISGEKKNGDQVVVSTASIRKGTNGKLYARHVEEGQLLEAYRRCCTAKTKTKQPELVLITGPSGTGKSRLAQSLRSRVVDLDGGFWACGKFDQLERPETSYPLVQAITDLVQQVLERRDEKHVMLHIYPTLEEIAHSENLLVDWIPALKQFRSTAIEQQPQAANPTPMDAPKQLALALCRLIKAVASPQTPLILFLDDIQWAKNAPLDVLRALINDSELTGFMMLAACRGNEVPMEHHLSATLRDLEATGVQLTDVQLFNLELAAVQDMDQDYLQSTDPGQLQELSQHVWDQTRGNVFFTIQLIRKIQRDEQYQQIQHTRPRGCPPKTQSYTTAVDLITEIIRRLPPDVLEVLKVASCFGAEFHSSLLEELLDFDIREALRIAEDEELIIRCSSSTTTTTCAGGAAAYQFLHDQIQQSSYSLIPEQERQATHLEIGRRLWNELNEQELKVFGFAVVRQIRLGSQLIRDEKERYQVADLLLKAGIHASKTSAFDEAASHFELGISLLPRRHWRDEYSLSLDLHRWAAELAYCVGNHERVGTLTEQTIGNARNQRDKLGAYISQIESLTATNQPKLAFLLALKVLRESGYKIPTKSSIITILYQLFKTKRKLKLISNAEIRNMPADNEREDITKVFNLATLNSVYAEPTFFPIVTMIGVQIALKEGLCGASSLLYAAFSMLLCCHFGDVDLGLRLAQLSLGIVDDMQAYHWQPRVFLFLHGFVFVIKDSIADQLAPLRTAHRQAMAFGDIEVGGMTAYMHSFMSFHASVPLRPLVSDMRTNLKVMQAHRQTIATQYLLPVLQGALNLLQESDQPTQLTGEVMDEEIFQKGVQASNNIAADAVVKFMKLSVACFLGEYDVGEQLANEASSWPAGGFSAFAYVNILLQCGICHAALAGKKTRKRLLCLKRNLRTMKRFVRSSEGRYDPHIHILEAEVEAIQGRTDAAIAKFQLAIDRAGLEGLHTLVGLANERASAILSTAGRKADAEAYLMRALRAFQTWGADAKVARLEQRLRVEYTMFQDKDLDEISRLHHSKASHDGRLVAGSR